MYEIDFHADDYAASLENSKRILVLLRAGRIDSLSVMTNMGCYAECMGLLRQEWDRFPRKPLLSVHINLIDGFWLSSLPQKQIIHNSWGKIFLHNFLPGRKKIIADYSREMEAQILAFLRETDEIKDADGNPLALRIDSHVHTHMIPLVFEALMLTLDRMNLGGRVRFIRCSAEPLSMFLSTPGIPRSLSPVNLLKNRVLHALSHSVRRKLQRAGIPTGEGFGVAMTGEMDLRRVSLLLPRMQKYAQGKDAYLEVLSHPGHCLSSEITAEYGPDDRKAFLAPQRDVEFDMLMNLPRNE